jgi:lipopolysaccharide exporter
MTLKQKAVSGVRWTGFSNAARSSLQLLQLAFLGRLLVPSDFGLMAMVMVAIGFAQLFADMGISNAIIYKQDSTREELSSLYWLNIFSGISIFVLVWISSPAVTAFYNEIRLTNLLRLTGVIFLIVPFGQQFQILLQRELKFKTLAGIEISSSVISTLTAILTAFEGYGVYSLVWGQLVGSSCRTSSLIFVGWKSWRPSFRFSGKDIKEYIGFGLYQMGERGINYFSWNLDKLLIGRLLGAEALGFYSVAYQLMLRPMQILNPVITKVAFPFFSKIQNDDSRLRSGYLQVVEVIAFVSMPVYFGIYAVSDSLVPLLLGQQWVDAVTIFNVLVILGIFYSIGNPIGSLLLAKGRADLGFWFNVFAVTISVPAIIVGSSWGVMGVAWALVLITAFAFFPCGFILRWFVIRMRPLEYIRAFFLFVLIACAMAVSVKILGHYVQISSPTIKLCVFSSVGVVFYMACVWFFKKRSLYNIINMIRS